MRDGNTTRSVHGASTPKEGLWDKIANYLWGLNLKPEPSRLTKDIEEVIRKHPSSTELLRNALEVSQSRDLRKPLYKHVSKNASELEKQSKKNAQLNRELEGNLGRLRKAESDIQDLIEETRKLVHQRLLLEKSFQTISDRKGASPILWGQSIDAIVDQMPDALDLISPATESPLFPKDLDQSEAVLETMVLPSKEKSGPITTAKLFVCAKSERENARLSEDRVGLSLTPNGFRAVAIDGVGGSSHSRHLARDLGESILEGGGIKSAVETVLATFGYAMNANEMKTDSNEKLAFLQKQKARGGASCVLAAVDYDSKHQEAKVHQIGDTVAFVEKRVGNVLEWEVLPKRFSEGAKFDSSPQQLSSLQPRVSARSIDVSRVANATGRVALATDGVAEFILRENVGIDKFVDSMESFTGDAEELLKYFRKHDITDDDLSFIMIQ